MVPLIRSGNLVEVLPITGKATTPVKGDIVLCKVSGHVYLHLVSAVKGDRFQISNNHGHVNGWTTLDKIYGVVNKVEP